MSLRVAQTNGNAAHEEMDHVTIAPRYELFIGGKWRPPTSKKYFDTVSPSTEEKLAEVAEASEKDVDAAVTAARLGHDRYWSKLRPLDRGKYIFRVARALQEKSRELAIVEAMDSGAPIHATRDVDLPLAAAHFFYYAGWADKLDYAFPGRNPRALGVAGQMIPWTSPLLMAAWKLAPALAAGNTCVLKPAETTPLTALLLARIIEEADLPPGVVNIVTGSGAAGAALVKHPGVDKVAFTGAAETGKRIQRALAGTPKKLTLELGGSAVHIVFADAPLDQAIEAIVRGAFFGQGRACSAGSRLLVEESAHDRLAQRLKDRMAALRLGDPLDRTTDVGAINSKRQLEKIQEIVAAGEREGAARFSAACALPPRGYWFAPTLFTGVAPSHRVAREPIVGPVLSILTFRTPEEAIERANDTTYGLCASVWTDSGSKSSWVVERLRAGVVWVNTCDKLDPSAPFGGYKESGFGREGGRQGLLAYLEVD
jgi:aldehyde dehydrogenase (NAD+)